MMFFRGISEREDVKSRGLPKTSPLKPLRGVQKWSLRNTGISLTNLNEELSQRCYSSLCKKNLICGIVLSFGKQF